VFGQFGILVPNLQALGLFTDSSSPFFQDRLLSHVAIGSMVVFRWTGYNALILLAAMQAVPRDLYEAATVDGAGRFRQFFSVTIPSIRPTLIFVILTMTIGGLEIFDEARLFDGGGTGGGSGGADNQWTTVMLYLFNLGFGEWQDRLGQAAAVGWIFAFIILIISLLNFVLTRSISSSDAPRVRTRRRARRTQRDDAARNTKPAAPVAAEPMDAETMEGERR
jgi:cellobiose transport system permease protein